MAQEANVFGPDASGKPLIHQKGKIPLYFLQWQTKIGINLQKVLPVLGSQFRQSMDHDPRCLQNVTYDDVLPLEILVQITDFMRDMVRAIRIGLDRDASHGSS